MESLDRESRLTSSDDHLGTGANLLAQVEAEMVVSYLSEAIVDKALYKLENEPVVDDKGAREC